ncbi:uncharacterized protein LOC126299165 [Schistocerca gregaria]|uniref:uncharacterized protein LOC126299165 n=1 Tax=Schistocerca gregaria TaxID=7010 RepID=UPI00211EDED1|nr:uncharacterized protein LOC126299165 [Schistocerca gregaria]
MEFFSFLLSIFVSTAVLKEPTTNPRNFTHVVPEHEPSDRQYYNGPDFSQAPTGSLKVDNAALSDDMDDFTKLYDELDLTKENTHLESTNTLQSEMDTKEHFQQYTTETSAAEMEYLEQWYDEMSVTTGQGDQDSLTPQSELNTTVWNETSVLQVENTPLHTTTIILKVAFLMLILCSLALNTAAMWIMLSKNFTFLSIKYNVTYRMKNSSAELLTVEYEDTVTV